MILLYHTIVSSDAPSNRWCIGQALPQNSFARQLEWLSKFGSILSLPEYLEATKKRTAGKHRLFALTFDDGHRATFRFGCPVMRSMNIPATFFVSTGHLENGRILWFSYLNALCFESSYALLTCDGYSFPLRTPEERKTARRTLGEMARKSGKPETFCRQLANFYPVPSELGQEYAGMTFDELGMMSRDPLFEIGAHTVSHPFLSRLSLPAQSEEIYNSKQLLSEKTGRCIRYFAYPGGDYNSETLALVKEAGYEAAFATLPRALGSDGKFEIGRVGIYSRSLLKFGLKAIGITSTLNRLGIATG